MYLEIEIRRVHCRSCDAVKQEKLPWLANNPFYTKRFGIYYVNFETLERTPKLSAELYREVIARRAAV